MHRLCLLLFVALVSAACASRPDFVEKRDPLEGLVPAGHVLASSPVRLGDLPAGAGVAVIPSATSQRTMEYVKAFDEAVNGDTIDLFGNVAEGRAAADPRHSVLFITAALERCFGRVVAAKDIPQASKLAPPLIAVVDLILAYPFWGAHTADYELVFLDKQGRLIERIQAHGEKVPMPFQNEEALVIQRRAAADLNKKLQEALPGKCSA